MAASCVVATLIGGAFRSPQEPKVFSVSRDQIPEACQTGPLTPFSGAMRMRRSPEQPKEYASQVVHPGVVTLKDRPTMAYHNEGSDFSTHARRAGMLRQTYEAQLKQLSELQDAEKAAVGQDTVGFRVDIEDPIPQKRQQYTLALNPQTAADHKAAESHTATWIGRLAAMKKQEVCREIRITQRILMRKMEGKWKGRYRNGAIFVFENLPEKERSIEGIARQLQKKGATPKEMNVYWSKVVPKIVDSQENFTPEERAVLEKVVYLPPPTDQIGNEMEKLAQNMIEMAQQRELCPDFDPVAFAAFVHREIGRIHPFGDANGRVARVLMNGILNWGGYPSVVFPSEEAYTAAVQRDARNPGYFATYLRDKILPMVEHDLGPDALA